jgi:O-antigen/teichoic acid export membrane protein
MVSWWLSNSANKIFISILLGATANGIYAVANKIPSLISVFYSIFTQAWQISAVEEYKNKDAGKFFGSVFTATFGILIVGVSLITLFSKELVLILSTNAYFEAWKVVPWLALAVLFSSLSSFLGTIYTSSMKTMALFTTTLVGGIINVICNLLLIPIFGIIGAGIGACVSFLCVALIRLKDSKKFISIKLEWLPIILSFFILSIEIIILFFMNGLASFLFMALCVVILFVINGFPFFKLLKNHIR